MRQLIAGSVLAVAAGLPLPAQALSCEVYSIRTAYWSYQNAEGRYLLALGSFSDLRRVSVDAKEDLEVWSARFDGHRASRRAFDQPFATDVTLILRRYSGIAGGEQDIAALVSGLPGKTGLVWLQETPSGFAADNGLCEPFLDTDPASIKPALQCLRGGYCPKR